MNRPEARNAANGALARGIAAALDELDADPGLSVAILTGAGGTFCAGMDLKAFATGDLPMIEGRGFAGIAMAPPSKPIIAAVEGYAVAGGFEIALACDLIVAASDARFGLPETKRGLVAGGGGLLRLPHRMPAALALEYALTGEHFGAEDAARWGLVNHVSDHGGALNAAITLARRISANGPLAVRATKQVFTSAAAWSEDEKWERQQEILDPVFRSADAGEGARAFAEKRNPVWRGK